MSRLGSLLHARSVAIVGASSDPSKITGRPLAYMLARGYRGELYAVNSGRLEVQGLRTYPSLAAIGKPVDLAIVGTPAHEVENIISEGIEVGIKAFVVFSSGFAEMGEEGEALQQRLSRMAKENSVTILGPNCLGVANSATGLIASFTTALESTPLQQGGFALVSQSGALGAYWLDIVLRSGLGFSHWITTGNECDADAAEAIDFLVDDPDTKVIGLYIEDIRNTLAFRRALLRAAIARKPVIAIKSGRSEAGMLAAASHTGALAGNDALYDACLRQHGALRVDSLTAMIDTARLFLYESVPADTRLGVMSVSGGAGVLIADEAEALQMTVGQLGERTCEELEAALPPFVRIGNPVDLTGNVVQNTASLSQALSAIAVDPNIDAIVLFVGMMHSIAHAFTEAISETRQRIRQPIIVVWMSGPPEAVSALEKMHVPVFTDIPPAMRALAAAVNVNRLQSNARDAIVPSNPTASSGGHAAHTLTEWEGKQLLAKQKAIAVPQGILIGPDMKPAIAGLAYPVAAKLQAAELMHKSDAGGVILKIDSDAALVTAVHRLREIGSSMAIDVQGILVEQMVRFDHELLLGLRRDPRFGPVLTIARGGIEVELDADVVTRLLPLDAGQIENMLRSLRSARLFDGFRQRPAADIPAVAERIAALCEWFMDCGDVTELEINPLAVQGSDVWALDALVTASP
jgi:acyl-CoA synthetase (NDP forming)